MDKLAIYLRLSLEDADDKDESNSISSQRAMLHAYIRGNEELRGKEVLEFCDRSEERRVGKECGS